MSSQLDADNQRLVRESAIFHMERSAALVVDELAELARSLWDKQAAPHVLMRPDIARDGNKWSVLYGSNIMDGVCGYGDTPAEAMADFDQRWREQRITVHDETAPTIGALMDAIMEPDADCTAETVRAEVG